MRAEREEERKIREKERKKRGKEARHAHAIFLLFTKIRGRK